MFLDDQSEEEKFMQDIRDAKRRKTISMNVLEKSVFHKFADKD